VTVHHKFLYNKTNQMHEFPKFTPAWNYMFRAVPLPIIRSLFTVHSALAYVIQVLKELSSRTRMVLRWEIGAFGWFYYKESWRNFALSGYEM